MMSRLPVWRAIWMASYAPLSGWMRPKKSRYSPAFGRKVKDERSMPWYTVAA